MKRLLAILLSLPLLLMVLAPGPMIHAQANPQIGHGAPTGVCLGPYTDTDTGNFYVCKVGQYVLAGGGGGGGVVGGTFGGSPSSGYTFTSTPITTNPFGGDLLVGSITTASNQASVTAGTGYTIIAAPANALGAMEYQLTAGSASSYSAPFTLGTTSTWGSSLATFSCAPTCAFVQGTAVHTATTLAYSSNVGSGHLLVATIRYNTGSNGGPITGVTCTGNTFQSAGARAPQTYSKGVGDGTFLEVWFVSNSTSAACTVTPAGISNPTNIDMSIAEFSGANTTSPLVDFAITPITGSSTTTTTPVGSTTNNQYTINAVNNVTGVLSFTGRDSCSIERSAAATMATGGGQLLYKNGIYPCQSSIQEVNNSQTTSWYGNATWPSPSGNATQASWHIIGESFTQPTYVAVDYNGVITLMLPSAYAGPQANAGSLKGWYTRPAPAALNNSIFFVNHTCFMLDNQRVSTCFDTSQSTYSYHENLIASTVIPVLDVNCSGITPSVNANTVIGFLTNQPLTNETYFENTWAIGWNVGYIVQSNHPHSINQHTACSQNAANFTVTSSLYGGIVDHFQDIHNTQGITFNCTQAGTRYDFRNMVIENAASGPFLRTNNAIENNPGNCVGTVGVTTSNLSNALVTPFFNAGSGANMRGSEGDRVLLPGLASSSSTSAATTGTTKQTLATYTIPYNAGGTFSSGIFQNNPGGVYKICAAGITAANANTKTVEIDMAGTSLITINSVANGGSLKICADIVVGATGVQSVWGYADDGTLHPVLWSNPANAGTNTVVVTLAATTPTASGDFTFKGWWHEYVGGQ